MSTPDVLVVGGGPAGLVTAIECALRGLEVTVLERRAEPTDDAGLDKPCGEGLMPDGVERLEAIGVDLGEIGRPFVGIRYVDPVASDTPTVVDGRFPAGHGIGIRRTRLHRRLIARANAVGVTVRWGARVAEVESPADAVTVRLADGSGITARTLVAADGLRSPIRHQLGLAGRDARWRRFGVRRHVAIAPWSDRVEVHWSDVGEAYVTPVGSREVGIAILWSGEKAGFDTLIDRFPLLAEHLDRAEPTSRDRGIGPLRQRVRDVVRGRVALVGDASGYVDAITGEGLTVAFHQAQALATALAEGKLASYRRAHRTIGRVPWALTELLLAIERRPALRRRVLRALANDPTLFEHFLAVHCREASPWSLAPTSPRMLWRLATA
ncbi:MAG: NAD(P)/FAD-dependent oxidoreductase [Acidobacteriota bacterium]